MNIEEESYALGIYSYPKSSPSPKLYEEIYNLLNDLLEHMKIKPNYIGVDGVGYGDKLLNLNSSNYIKKLKKNGFSKIDGFTLVATPDNSEKPAFDYHTYVNVDYSKTDEELLICININKTFISSFDEFIDSITALSKIIKIEYVLGFVAKTEDSPILHIMGGSNGKLNEEQNNSLNKWYKSDSNTRKNKVRDIYSFNIYNKNQLLQTIDSEITLKDYLSIRINNKDFYQLDNTDLFLCNVPDNLIKEVRNTVSAIII